MVEYKCPKPGCKYTLNKSEKCCNQKMVKVLDKKAKEASGCSCC